MNTSQKIASLRSRILENKNADEIAFHNNLADIHEKISGLNFNDIAQQNNFNRNSFQAFRDNQQQHSIAATQHRQIADYLSGNLQPAGAPKINKKNFSSIRDKAVSLTNSLAGENSTPSFKGMLNNAISYAQGEKNMFRNRVKDPLEGWVDPGRNPNPKSNSWHFNKPNKRNGPQSTLWK